MVLPDNLGTTVELSSAALGASTVLAAEVSATFSGAFVSTGAFVGASVFTGAVVAAWVGAVVAASVGAVVAFWVGAVVAASVGAAVGAIVAASVGAVVAFCVGAAVSLGASVGASVGLAVSTGLGASVLRTSGVVALGWSVSDRSAQGELSEDEHDEWQPEVLRVRSRTPPAQGDQVVQAPHWLLHEASCSADTPALLDCAAVPQGSVWAAGYWFLHRASPWTSLVRVLESLTHLPHACHLPMVQQVSCSVLSCSNEQCSPPAT
mmetsp:Transcript_39307/g.83781  ORF Transcript_39307/g.83781 Transcript_39307/m.83781 type:complete len:264 (-) Transcript_39307:983-1774(-)